MHNDPSQLPDDLPRPTDDGASDHLPGRSLPSVEVLATDGTMVDLSATSSPWTVVYIYPRTGVPGVDPPTGWDDIPGARGCTPQSCAFRDLHGEFEGLGVDVLGLSAQSGEDQLEFAERVHLPFPVLSDPDLRLAEALGLPTFETAGMTLYARLTMVIRDGEVTKVFFPVFPPDRNASDVLAWLASDAGATP